MSWPSCVQLWRWSIPRRSQYLLFRVTTSAARLAVSCNDMMSACPSWRQLGLLIFLAACTFDGKSHVAFKYMFNPPCSLPSPSTSHCPGFRTDSKYSRLPFAFHISNIPMSLGTNYLPQQAEEYKQLLLWGPPATQAKKGWASALSSSSLHASRGHRLT